MPEKPDEVRDETPEAELEEEHAGSRMPFLGHLTELRGRLMKAGIAVFILFVAAFFFKEQIYQLLKAPLAPHLPAGSKLIYTSPQELFFTYMKVSFLAAVVAASPVIFYQIWRFISPGLYERERKMAWPFVIISSLLFISGAVFCYLVVFPFAFAFFMSLATDEIVPMLKVNEYLSFSSSLLFLFGLTFETPLVLYFMAKLGIVNAGKLRKNRRYAILIIFVVAAVATPTPDVITQILMAAPLMLLYEFSILLIARAERQKTLAEQAAEAAEAAAEHGEEKSA
ncbi:MAG: twin-arginine translocase subunit TatC [Pseudomonadota bacterium]